MFRRMRNVLLCLFLCSTVLPASPAPGETTGQAPGLTLVPNAIPIGLFYHEGSVAVTGTLPRGYEPALVVQGEDRESRMSIRGRNYGLWMGVGTATFEQVPSFYQCLTARPVDRIAEPGAARENGLTEEQIKERMRVDVVAAEANVRDNIQEWKDEFVCFMEQNGLFGFREDALRVTPGPAGMEEIRGEILLPARAPEGRYRVTLIGFRDGVPEARVEETLTVNMVGAVGFLRDLAVKHGWIYGLVAVLVALTAGLGVGAIIPSRGGH
jgi:uncharacterized protein (TIGR02186 family)